MAKQNAQDIGFLQAVVNNKFKEAAELLARNPASLNALIDGEATLHRAARRSLRQVQWLVQRGADLEVLDSSACTPLMAACYAGGKIGSSVALFLIAQGANVRYRRDGGDSALEIAAGKCEPKVVAELAKTLPINGPRGCAQTPAMHAVRHSNLPVLKLLIQLGANLQAKCNLPWGKGMTCLDLARLEKRHKMVAYLESLKK